MNYPIVIHKDKDSDYGVTVPDLSGCFSAGKTLDEALAMAKEAIEFHMEELIESGQPVPKPKRIEDHRKNRDYAGGTWAVVSVDSSTLRAHAKRINITIPERVLDAVDRFARRNGETRSGLLTKAAATYIDHSGRVKPPKAKRGRRTKQRLKSRT